MISVVSVGLPGIWGIMLPGTIVPSSEVEDFPNSGQGGIGYTVVFQIGSNPVGARAARAGGGQMDHIKAVVVETGRQGGLSESGQASDGYFGSVSPIYGTLFQHVEHAARAPGPSADGTDLRFLIGIQIGRTHPPWWGYLQPLPCVAG